MQRRIGSCYKHSITAENSSGSFRLSVICKSEVGGGFEKGKKRKKGGKWGGGWKLLKKLNR